MVVLNSKERMSRLSPLVPSCGHFFILFFIYLFNNCMHIYNKRSSKDASIPSRRGTRHEVSAAAMDKHEHNSVYAHVVNVREVDIKSIIAKINP